MFVITGVTGNTGSVVADTLLSRGEPVRVVVRESAKGEAWKARGAEVAVATLEDTAALTKALRGARGAFLLVPPVYGSATPLEDNRRLIASLATATREAQVPHVVLLSSIGAQHPNGTGPIQSLHEAEEALAPITALTAVRAGYFMENWASSLGALSQGVLPTFLPKDQSYPMVATRDIGHTAATALLEGPRGLDVIDLAGPREYSASDVAVALARITGKPVAPAEAPLDAVVPALTSHGMSKAAAELLRGLYAGMISGRVAPDGGKARTVRGVVPVEEVLRRLLDGSASA